MSRRRSLSGRTREQRAVDQFACPACKARPGQPCTGHDGKPMLSLHGPGCHSVRRKLTTTIIPLKAGA
jgi:hypothetical protein